MLLVLLVVVSYLPALAAGFVWDDALIIQSDLLQDRSGLWPIWFAPDRLTNEVHYWPVVYSSFWLENQLWGHNPIGYHAVNIGLHAINTLLLWRLMRQLSVAGAWVIAAVFAVHPLHVESVAWVIERKDLLSGLFFLTAASAYIRYTENRTGSVYAWVLTCFTLGMLSKSIVVTLPVSLWLWHWWNQGRVSWGDSLRILPLLLLGLGIAIADLIYFRSAEVAPTFDYSLLERALIATRALVFYLGKILWPVDLAIIYPYWDTTITDPLNWIYAIAVMAVLGLLWGARHRCGRGPLVGALFFGITLSPVLGFVDHSYMAFSLVADRFQYLAGIGIMAILIGCVAYILPARWSMQESRLGVVVVIAVLALLATATWQQTGVYQHDGAFNQHIIDYNPTALDAHKNLGGWLMNQERVTEAVAAYRTEVNQRPQSALNHYNLGVALYRLGKPVKALLRFQHALELDPAFEPARSNRDFILNLLPK